jgi:hypothetical protein
MPDRKKTKKTNSKTKKASLSKKDVDKKDKAEEEESLADDSQELPEDKPDLSEDSAEEQESEEEEEEDSEQEEENVSDKNKEKSSPEDNQEAKQEAQEKSTDEDLSKYTVGASGQAPVQEQNMQSMEHGKDDDEKKKKVVGFGLSPKLKDVIEDDIPLERRNRRLFFIGIIITAFILGATAATLYFRVKQGNFGTNEVEVKTEETEDIAQSETSSPEPTSTPTPRSEITLEILNGSGVSGLAGDTADEFEALGYVIDNTGNADTAQGNQLYIQKGLDQDQLKYLMDDVKDKLNITEITAELSSLDVSARIVLGSQVEETASPSASPSSE